MLNDFLQSGRECGEGSPASNPESWFWNEASLSISYATLYKLHLFKKKGLVVFTSAIRKFPTNYTSPFSACVQKQLRNPGRWSSK